MKNSKITFSLFILTLIAYVQLTSAFAQKVELEEKYADSNANSSQTASLEESIVRATYRKMTIIDTVQKLIKAKKNKQPTGRELGLKTLRFYLKDFRVGQIQEIQNAVYRDLATPSIGEVIQVSPVNSMQSNGKAQVSIDVAWRNRQYISGFDPQLTVGDILQQESVRFYDVGRYASYEVTVTLEGRTKTYRALALFHNLYQSQGNPKPEFLDNIVGMDGFLTQISKNAETMLGANRTSNPLLEIDNSSSVAKVNRSSSKKPSEQNQPNLMAPPEGGGACLEWYYTPIDPTYTFCMTYEPGWGGGGETYEIIEDGSNTIYYKYIRHEYYNSTYKKCVFRACLDTDQNPSNGCFDSTYHQFEDYVTHAESCGLGVRITYSRYRIPLTGYSFCARWGHYHINTWEPCPYGTL